MAAWRVRHVLLATGIVDVLRRWTMSMPRSPAMRCACARSAMATGQRRTDRRAGAGRRAIRHAAFLRTFSQRVFAIPSRPGEASPDCLALARDAGVVVTAPPLPCGAVPTAAAELRTGDARVQVDTLYPVLGADAQSGLARRLGAAVDAGGRSRGRPPADQHRWSVRDRRRGQRAEPDQRGNGPCGDRRDRDPQPPAAGAARAQPTG